MSLPNINPATAIDLGVVSTSITLDLADFGSDNAWYKCTIPNNIYYYGIRCVTDDALYGFYGVQPYLADGTTPTSLFGDYIQLIQQPVTPTLLYYFEVQGPGGVIAPGSLITIDFNIPTNDAVVAGDLCIPDNETAFPSVVLASTTGALRKVLGLPPASSFGADIDFNDGTLCIEKKVGSSTSKVELYDDQLALINSVNPPVGWTVLGSMWNQNDLFYIWFPRIGATPAVTTIDKLGNYGATTWTLSGTDLGWVTADAANTILYWVEQGLNTNAIKRWDIVGNIAMADLVAGIVGYRCVNLLTLADGTILAAYRLQADRDDIIIRQYNAAGATLATVTVNDNNFRFDRICRALDDPISFWLWTETQLSLGQSKYQNIRISDGAILATFTKDYFSDGVSAKAGSTVSEDFGPADSGPMFVFPFALTGPVGTITVGKVTSPLDAAHVFTIAGGGGLDTAPYNLSEGDSHDYVDVPEGNGYSVIENPDPDWYPIYLISNDPTGDNLNINVGDGEIVTVMILNQLGSPGGGLYEYPLPGNPSSGNPPALPGSAKTNDDFVEQDASITELAIPEPFIVTGFIGDE